MLDQLRKRGVPCIDSDTLAHAVTSAGTEATAAIADRFGTDILAPDGSVNRAKLGAIVFADPAARNDLEAIVHPAVYRAIAAGLRGFELLDHDPGQVAEADFVPEVKSASVLDSPFVSADGQTLVWSEAQGGGRVFSYDVVAGGKPTSVTPPAAAPRVPAT